MSDRPNWKTLPREERDRLLTEACGRDLTASQIAALFTNASRSAVLGLIHRLQKAGHKIDSGNGQKGRPAASAAVGAKPKPNAPRKALGRKIRIVGGVDQLVIGGGPKPVSRYDFKARAEQRASAPPIAISRAAAFDPILGVKPVPFGSAGCKFPVDGLRGPGLLWCGAHREEGQPYCSAHHRLSIQPPAVTQRASEKAEKRAFA